MLNVGITMRGNFILKLGAFKLELTILVSCKDDKASFNIVLYSTYKFRNKVLNN